jgi:hypothetical protein
MRLSQKNISLNNLAKKKIKKIRIKSNRKKQGSRVKCKQKINFFSQMTSIATKRIGPKFKK